MAGCESGVRAMKPRYRLVSEMDDSRSSSETPETLVNVATATADGGGDGRDAPGSGANKERRWPAVVASVLGVVVALAVVAGFVVHLPYVIISPGFATPLDKKVIEVEGAKTYQHRGDVLFLTVRVTTHDPTVWRLVVSWFDSDRQIVKRRSAVGCLSDSENVTINQRLMQQSQDDAKDVALTRLGYAVDADPPEVTVVEVCAGAPAYGALRAGDRVLSIDGHAVDDLSDVRPLVRAHRPGESVTVTSSRAGTTTTSRIVAGRVAARTHTCEPAALHASGTTCLGVTMQPFVTYRFPIDVSIDTDRVGGPSAGLAFALAIIDDLTPGDLTGGRRVAVTGTITGKGEVGAVGGVEQKAVTARHNHAALMIVPKSELADARRGAGKLQVVGVDTLDEALAALRRAGGDPVPPAVSPAARS
jgi:PDZ domain-containing protein